MLDDEQLAAAARAAWEVTADRMPPGTVVNLFDALRAYQLALGPLNDIDDVE